MSLVSGPGRGGGVRSDEDTTDLTLYTKQHIDYIVSLNTVSSNRISRVSKTLSEILITNVRTYYSVLMNSSIG